MQNKPHDRELQLTFPVGYLRFHRDQLFNFPLNRWYSQGYARREDMAEAGEEYADIVDVPFEQVSY